MKSLELFVKLWACDLGLSVPKSPLNESGIQNLLLNIKTRIELDQEILLADMED
jgi:hypothetical protein